MTENITIRPGTNNDHEAILKIAAILTDWFDEDAIIRAIPTDLHFHKTIVAEIENKIVGFVTYTSHEGNVFIGWLGVDNNLHRHGIGTKLIEALEQELLSLGITKYEVETLSETIDHPPYIPTRAFYEKMGFEKGKSREIISTTGEKLELVTYWKNLRLF
ncbi:MAG: GNAT family N-acetyltransferase [bacterium]|nr:GNAT family N-acetyltransferase [bacterium]